MKHSSSQQVYTSAQGVDRRQSLVQGIKPMEVLELQKDNNIISLADCNRQIKDTETRILKLVSEAGSDILEDEELILTLD